MINFFKEVLMQLPANVSVLKGPDFVIELINPPAQEAIGDRQVLGKTVIEALPEVQGQGYMELLDSVYQTGEVFSSKAMPAKIIRDGKEVQLFADITYVPLRNNEGKIEGIISFSYDVTDAVNAQMKLQETLEELRQSYEDLEVKVKFRNLELEKENTALKQKLAALSAS